MRLLLHWVLSAVAVWIVAHIVPGISVSGPKAALIAAAVIGLVNATLGLLLKIVTFPLTILTLGLFWFVINALMLELAAAGERIRGAKLHRGTDRRHHTEPGEFGVAMAVHAEPQKELRPLLMPGATRRRHAAPAVRWHRAIRSYRLRNRQLRFFLRRESAPPCGELLRRGQRLPRFQGGERSAECAVRDGRSRRLNGRNGRRLPASRIRAASTIAMAFGSRRPISLIHSFSCAITAG